MTPRVDKLWFGTCTRTDTLDSTRLLGTSPLRDAPRSTGNLPEELGNLPALKWLSISENEEMEGKVPLYSIFCQTESIRVRPAVDGQLRYGENSS